jgi:hypothetical protein
VRSPRGNTQRARIRHKTEERRKRESEKERNREIKRKEGSHVFLR